MNQFIYFQQQIYFKILTQLIIKLLNYTQDPYLLSKRADTIKSEIEQRFKFRWSIILYSNDSQIEFSFVYGDEFTLQLRSESYCMLAYIIPDQPQTQYEPRRDVGVTKPQFINKTIYGQQDFENDYIQKRFLQKRIILFRGISIQMRESSSIISNPPLKYYPKFYP